MHTVAVLWAQVAWNIMKKLASMLLLHVRIAILKFVAFTDVKVCRNILIPVTMCLVLIMVKVFFIIDIFFHLQGWTFVILH